MKNLRDGTIQVMEEGNANKNAIKLLKNAGVSKEELKESKKALNNTLNNYKLIRKISVKNALYKTLKQNNK